MDEENALLDGLEELVVRGTTSPRDDRWERKMIYFPNVLFLVKFVAWFTVFVVFSELGEEERCITVHLCKLERENCP